MSDTVEEINPLRAPVDPNVLIGSTDSSAENFGLFSIKWDLFEYAARARAWDDTTNEQWARVRRDKELTLLNWGVQWDPDIVF